MIQHSTDLLDKLRTIHAAIRDAVLAACEESALEQLSAVVAEEAGDTIFAIDRVSEDVLLEHFHTLAETWPLILIAEGLGETGVAVLTASGKAEDAVIRVIVDPIDGTRGLMYQKRPAWILTGVAPNKGDATSLADIELAVMTEIPLVRQHLCDSLWAERGQGAYAKRLNRLTGEYVPVTLRPSRATTIAQGFGGLARFFPGARDVLAAIDDDIARRVLGLPAPGKVLAFEDQYICTGGQLYELLMGHDRWVADLRPLVNPILAERGFPPSMCCHPYDLCTELVAREAGVIVTGAHGEPLDAPLDVDYSMAWIGFANPALRDQVAPVLQAVLGERGLL